MKNKIHTIRTTLAALVAGLSLVTSAALADAPLKTALDLDIDQAAQVDTIQKNSRDAVRPVRGELKREERALRRAKTGNDAEAIAKQEKAIEPLHRKLAEIFESEAEEIRALLSPEQKIKYKKHLKERDEMVGSSRDVKEIKKSEEKTAE